MGESGPDTDTFIPGPAVMAIAHAERGIVRILATRPGPPMPVGAGFLIAEHYLLTCAHVVNESLGCDEYASDKPGAPIFLDLAPGRTADATAERSASGSEDPLSARVHVWYPAHEQPQQDQPDDIAVLRLEKPRDAVHVATAASRQRRSLRLPGLRIRIPPTGQ